MAKITINGITLDPIAEHGALIAANLIAANATASNYLMIQTRGPLTSAERQDLAQAGCAILEYIDRSTYLCHYEAADLDAIRNLPFVTWANVYMKGFKVAPSLVWYAPAGAEALNLMDIAPPPAVTLDTTPKTVDIVLHQGVSPEAVRERIASAVRLNPEDLPPGRNKVRVTVLAQYLQDVAAIDEVRHIEEVHPHKLNNDVARQILRIPSAMAGAALEGDGQVVAVADTGFDCGSTVDVHPAFSGRVAKLYALGRPVTGNANDPHGHGTHVAGSVLGDGTSQALGISIRGTAPRATLVFQSLLAESGLLSCPTDLRNLFAPPYANDGARVHTNAWGSTLGDGRYNQDCQELDDFVWHHRDGVICFAAGNEGIDFKQDGQVDARSIAPPGTAKNCITVGATENERPTFAFTYKGSFPNDFPVEPIASDRLADHRDGMVAFSGRGPTRNARIKPDVVAPGTFVLSSRSRVTSGKGWGLTEDPLYYFRGGTSMAASLVAGCAAVVREFLITQRGLEAPSAALVKALLINGAHDINGQYAVSEAPEIPNNAEGFGRVDMTATIGPFAAGVSVDLKDEGTALDTGEEETMIVAAGAGKSLKVTLVWTDPAGEALQNDLDLMVRAIDGQERHGNLPPGSALFDRDNNVEQVLWPGVPEGDVTITVRAHRITLLPQTYALVVRTS